MMLVVHSNQPMELNNYYLICNGEIFNHKKIINAYNFKTNSNSDCEVILHLYDYLINKINHNYNIMIITKIINFICNKLDGEFSFVLYDKTVNYIYLLEIHMV